nr:pentatricopeptide repeat-containing protein [Quercus suber]
MILKQIKRIPVAILQFKNFSITSQRYCPNPRDSSKLLGNSLKSGRITDAENLFDNMPDRDVVSYSIMIHGYAKNGFHKKSMELYSHMGISGMSSNSFTIVGVLVGTAGLQSLVLGQSIHGLVVKTGLESDMIVDRFRTVSYQHTQSVGLWNLLTLFLRRWVIFEISGNAIINGYGINGDGDTAIALYYEMRSCGEGPDSATYQSILSACSHAGLVDNGLLIFNQMGEENRIRPSREHYGCVVDLLSRAGCLPDAIVFARKFLEGTGPDVWRALLSGFVLHGNVGLAELAASSIFEQNPEGSDQVVLLSDVHASVGRFQEAESLRLSLKMKGLLKNPGISLLNGIPYDFG